MWVLKVTLSILKGVCGVCVCVCAFFTPIQHVFFFSTAKCPNTSQGRYFISFPHVNIWCILSCVSLCSPKQAVCGDLISSCSELEHRNFIWTWPNGNLLTHGRLLGYANTMAASPPPPPLFFFFKCASMVPPLQLQLSPSWWFRDQRRHTGPIGKIH